MRRSLFLLSLLAIHGVFGQKGVWRQVDNQQKLVIASKWSGFQNYQVDLDASMLEAELPSTAVRFKPFQLPTPDGELLSFMIEETSIMHPDLQAKYPSIRVYKGKNSKGETIRFNIDSKGLHAIAFTHEGTIYLDPTSDHYVSYYARDYKSHILKERIETESPTSPKARKVSLMPTEPKNAGRSSGSELRKYRIAIASEYEYTKFHGETVQGALEAIVTTLNRVVGIFENEVAITLELVAENDMIVFTDSASNPYLGLSDSQALDKNQEMIDDIIGDGNYDIGHVFKKGNSGLAGLGVACLTNSKARGITGTTTPQGDPFDVDFVSHEIGHQFDATHTWNGTSGQCSSLNRTASTAVEPGSGSTIMAYAGICSEDNLQSNSDPYFHSVSIDQMLTYVETGDGSSCAVISPTGNTPPTIQTIEGGHTIPISTPFKLTATGSDIDGDALTFTWEQIDIGPAGTIGNPVGTAPLFRSLSPTSSGVRYFPAMSTVLGDGTIKGETLPTTTRDLNFRATARDNNSLGGGITTSDLTVNVTDQAGPFRVTSQATSDTIPGGSVVLVQWDVAGTNEDPVNCETVNISLSEDGGANFTTTLVDRTANDGSEYVVMTNRASNDCRLMISASDNIFFHINTAAFVIEETNTPDFDILVRETPGTTCGDTLQFVVEAIAINGFAEPVNLEPTDVPEGTIVTLGQSSINPGNQTTLQVVNTSGIGTKSLSISGTANSTSKDLTFDVTFQQTPDAAPALFEPSDRETGVELTPELRWSALDNITTYQLQLARDDQFTDLVIDETQLAGTSFQVTDDLDTKTTYFWRVTGTNSCGNGPFASGKFITSNLGTTLLVAEDLPLSITDGNTTSSVITIDTDVPVSDVNVQDIEITHTFIGDISITLSSPSGTTVSLIDRICQGSDDMLVSLDDEAESADIPCPPTDGLTYRPENLLTAFDGESALGGWTLRVTDNFTGDFGSLDGWKLEIGTLEEAIWLFANATAPGEVDLTWTNLATNQGYEVEVSTGNGAFEALTSTPQNGNNLKVENLTPSTRYTFRVRALVADSVSDYSNSAPITSLPEIPSPPSDLTGVQSSGFITLTWTDNDNIEEGFVVERATDSETAFEEITRTNADVTTYIDESIELGVDYAYQVRAFNISGLSEAAGPLLLSVLALDEVRPEQLVYPNPASTSLQVPSEALRKATRLSITDLQGKKVTEANLTSEGNRYIDISKLTKGLYFLQIHSDQELLQVQRFYKE